MELDGFITSSKFEEIFQVADSLLLFYLCCRLSSVGQSLCLIGVWETEEAEQTP